jgi:flavin reductase (DIM6/NTAB) family NADH-FMN oxidoreductase RutF
MSSSWVTQVSGEPPLLAIAVDPLHRSHALLERSGVCALNVVGASSRHLEDYFYSRASQRDHNLAGIAHQMHPSGAPVLSEVAVALVCRVRARHALGDHSLFVVAVEDVICRAPDPPLTSQDLEYVYVGTVIRR